MVHSKSLLIIICVHFIITALCLDNGVGLYPAMGFNSWAAFGCHDLNETVIKEITDQMVQLNLRKYGYEYINLDDCWQGGRYKNGSIYANTTTFNASLRILSDYIRERGFKFGLYTSRRNNTCSGKPASLGYEEKDAQTYISWNVEYLKEDTCGGENDPPSLCFQQYAKMRDALNNTNGAPPIYFSLCGNADWYSPIGASLGNSWRISRDDDTSWKYVLQAIDVEAEHNMHLYSGAGNWNDPDILIANGPHHIFTEQQSRFQFSMWAILAAPLLISSDLRYISQYTLETYTNQHVIGVNQDGFRLQGRRIKGDNLMLNNTNVWARELMDGSRAFMFINGGYNTADVICDANCFSNAGLVEQNVTVLDYWNDMKLIVNHTTTEPFVVYNLESYSGFVMYKFVPVFDY